MAMICTKYHDVTCRGNVLLKGFVDVFLNVFNIKNPGILEKIRIFAFWILRPWGRENLLKYGIIN